MEGESIKRALAPSHPYLSALGHIIYTTSSSFTYHLTTLGHASHDLSNSH